MKEFEGLNKKNLKEKSSVELFEIREKALEKHAVLVEALNTNKGRAGKTTEQIKEMHQNERNISAVAENIREILLERQGREALI